MGKLNILHHKEWHVYSKANRDKVKKDESIAQEAQDLLHQKVLKAEQEAKLELLRKRSHLETPKEHFNLFKEEEKLENCEFLKSEKDIEYQKLVDRHTWYLGETRDGKKENPWYARSGVRVSSGTQTNTTGDTNINGDSHLQKRLERKKRADEIQKSKADPLTFIQNATSKISKPTSSSDTRVKAKGPKTIESIDTHVKAKGPKTIEELRKERLERELRERERMQGNPDSKRHEQDSRYYHSQFHPDVKPTAKWYH